MFDLSNIWEAVCSSIARVAEPRSNLYWLYFFSASGIAFIVYWLRRYGHERTGVRGFLAFCFPSRIYAHRSARLDFQYFAVNTILFGALIAPQLLTSAAVAHGTVAMLVGLLGIPQGPLLPGSIWADVERRISIRPTSAQGLGRVKRWDAKVA